MDHWQSIARPDEDCSTTFQLTVTIQTQMDGETRNIELQEEGFAICKGGEVYAYRNHCPHTGSPLDWMPNQFFSDDKEVLVCHTHGAKFNPTNGDCISGPCPHGLYSLPVKEVSDNLIQVPTSIAHKKDY